MYEDGPFIVIAQAPAHIAHSSRLDGVDIFDSYTIDLTEINVNKQFNAPFGGIWNMKIQAPLCGGI